MPRTSAERGARPGPSLEVASQPEDFLIHVHRVCVDSVSIPGCRQLLGIFKKIPHDGKTMCMYLMPLTAQLKMVKMVNFICIFYHNI